MKGLSVWTLVAFVQIAASLRYAPVKIVNQPAHFGTIDSKSTRINVIHTLPVVPRSLEEDGTLVMTANWFKNYTKPCSECILKYIAVSLDGQNNKKTAKLNLDSFVLSIEGPGRVDSACGAAYPHGERIMQLVRGGLKSSETFFFSKGEDSSAGIWLGGSEDKLSMSVQVGGIPKEAKTVAMNVTVEFVPALGNKQQQRAIRDSFKSVKGVFLDLAQCGSVSAAEGPELDDEKDGLTSGSMNQPWIAPFNGKWLSAIGQDLSAGGRAVELSSNGQTICSSRAKYAFGRKDKEEGVYPKIAGYEKCSQLGGIKRGDKIEMKAMYESAQAGVTGAFAGYLVIE